MKWEIAQFFEIRWWQHYLGQQEVEDYLSRKKNYWEGILSACPFALSPSYRILDAGCGPAGIFTILQDYQVDAIDPLIDQYEKVLPHFSRRQYPNTQFFPTTFEHFSPTATYDLVFCLNAVNHFKNITLAMEKLGTPNSPWPVAGPVHRYSQVAFGQTPIQNDPRRPAASSSIRFERV
jgi:2-polyprenyl-3-methyl-5-hydroxy-6-metoxy-1,4-benzoquinol methylase